MNTFSDRFFLITVAMIASALAWFFWSSLKQDAFIILNLLVLVLLIIDNKRLRK